MSRVSQKDNSTISKNPLIQRLAIIQQPFVRLFRHRLNDVSNRRFEVIEGFLHFRSITEECPTLLEVAQFLLWSSDKSNYIKLSVLINRVSEEVLVFTQPHHCRICRKRPILDVFGLDQISESKDAAVPRVVRDILSPEL